MKSQWWLVGVSLGLAVSVAGADTTKKGMEVIDLDPPRHSSNLPLDSSKPEPTAAAATTIDAPLAASAGSTESTENASAAVHFTEIENKKNERLSRIREIFGKMKDEVSPHPRGFDYSGPSDVSGRIAHAVRPSRQQSYDEPPGEDRRGSREESLAGERNYRVQRGDTLAKIAKRFYGTASKFSLIADANSLSPTDRIHVGQQLTIPAADGESAASAGSRPARAKSHRRAARVSKAQAAAESPSSEPAPAAPVKQKAVAPSPKPAGGFDWASYEFKLYQVQAGDTLASVAGKFYHGKGGPSLIKASNNNRESFKPGEKILIPLPLHGGKGQ